LDGLRLGTHGFTVGYCRPLLRSYKWILKYALMFLILNQVGDRRDAYPAAGCQFEFSAKTIQPLTKLLREELEKL